MQISALYQNLIKELVSKITLETIQDINLGDLLTARVKAVDGDTVLLRLQGRDIPAKTLIPLEIGETITFQYQGIEAGKAFFRLVDNNLPQRESEFVARVLQSFDLPDTATNREIVNQMIRQLLPLDKKDVIQLGNLVKNLQIPTEEIEPAIFLFRQGVPPTPENIKLLREFQFEELNLFQGLKEIKNLVTDNHTIAPALKDEITLLLNKLSYFQITTKDSGSEILTKLSQAPSFILKRPEGQGLTTTPLDNVTAPHVPNNAKIIITGNSESSEQNTPVQTPNFKAQPTQDKITFDLRKPANTSTPAAGDSDPSPALPINRENILNQLEVLAGKSMVDHEKLSSFMKYIRDILKPQKEEIQEMINKISTSLDSSKPEEHAIKAFLKDISNRFDFVDNIVQRAPTDSNQQIVFYTQVFLKDNSNQEKPVTITIKQSKDQRDKKINFDNCNLAISLQTENLSLVKANVKKSAQKLTCQLIVNNATAKNILDPVLPELAEALEKLNFSVSIRPVIIETLAKKEQAPVGQDISTNLFNIDIRI